MPVHIIVKNTRTMDMTIDQQVALDEALVPHASRLRIGKSNFHLRSDISSKQSPLQLATATVHHHSIRFKMDNKKLIINLEYFKEMMHICPRLPGQTFDDLQFEEEIMVFLRFLRHSIEIMKLIDVNINKLHQPWRSFAAIINNCLIGKSTGYDSLRLSQAQILWGLYHKKNVDFAYLLWEDFVYQVEYKDAKKRNKMYYPRDDQMFTTIKLVLRHQNIQQFGVMLPIELTNEDIKNYEAYKVYYAVASGAAPPKTKASIRKTKSSFDTSITPPTIAVTRLSTFAKGKQPAKASKAKNEGTSIILGVPDVPTEESDEEFSWKLSDEEDDDDVDEGSDDQDSDAEGEEFIHPKLSIHDEEGTKDEKSFDHIAKTPENSDDEGNDDENLSLNIGSEEGQDAEDDEDELYRDVNINLEGRVVQMADVYATQEFKDTHVTLTPVNLDGQQQSSSVSLQFVTSMLNPIPDAGIDSFFETTSQMDVQAPITVGPLTLSAPTHTPLTISTTSTSDRLRDEAQVENEEFLKNLDENIQKIIKEQVKEHVKVQVSKILLKIEKTVNEQLEAEVLTRSSNSSKTSYAVVTDLSKMELKKILIKKMEVNKSIHQSDEQRNLYKALVEAYESDKIILDTYGDIVTLKRHRDDDTNKDEEPSAGLDRGSKRQREGNEPESTSAPKEKATRTTGKSTQGLSTESTQSRHLDSELLAGPIYELMKGSCKSLVELEFFLEEVYKATTDQLGWNNPEGHQYPHNLLKPLPLIPNYQGHRVIPFDHFINNDLEYLRGGASSRKYTTSVTKTKAAVYRHIEWIADLVPCTMESARDVYSKRRIIAVTELQIVEWHNYKHLDWIMMHIDDEKLYKFKEGDFKKLRIQDIEDMLLLLVQGKLTNLTVEERFAFNVSLRIDGTLNDVCAALDDHLKGIRMKYLPQTI
nr:hypothetical protein [Tanacetum cinerariifolium]